MKSKRPWPAPAVECIRIGQNLWPTAAAAIAALLVFGLTSTALGQQQQPNAGAGQQGNRRQPAQQRRQLQAPGNQAQPGDQDPTNQGQGNPADRDPPGAQGDLPRSMDKIAQAADIDYQPKPDNYRVKFNLQDADLAELVNHISGMTGKRFIYGAKVRQIKATVVSPEPVTLAEAYEAFLSILEVNGMTVVPHGRFLKIVDSAGITNQATPVYSRGAPVPDADRFVTRLYRVKYVSADEVAQLLSKFKSKEGDVSAYGPGQLLIITDTGANVRRMIRIIEEVDVGGAGQQMWIEPVNYGAAGELAERVNELFGVGKEGDPTGGGSGLSRVIADEQTNSLIVVGQEEAYLKMLEVLKRLDTRPTESGKVHVLPLQHAVAEELANTLSQMLSGQRTAATQARGARGQQGGGGPGGAGDAGGMFEGAVQVTPDQATNSLVITSTARDYAQLRLVIDRLDQPRRQVFIEAVIMDVNVSDSTQLGFSFHGGAAEDIGGGGNTLFLGGFQAGQSVSFPADPNLLQGFAAGVRGPDLPGTSNLLGTGLSIPAFGVVMNALAQSGRGNVLATPHIIATDNVAAEINVGDNIPLQTNVGGLPGLGALGGAAGQQGGLGAGALLGALGGGLGFSAPRQDVGNRIRVTPHINDSDQVRLEIEQESSSPGTPVGALGAVPIQRRTANTTVVVKDQQTVVIGGLMRDEYTTSKDKIPVLGDLPVLGFLFRRSSVTKRKSNLLLILTPHVIREQADLRRIFERKMRERQEFIDRYFVFATDQWEPPTDYTRLNGLVEDIRQAQFEIEEMIRLEEESRPSEVLEHRPSEPIELPMSQPQGGAPQTQQPARPQPQRERRQQQRRNRRNRESPQGANESPLRIAPVARSMNVDNSVNVDSAGGGVNVERVE